HATTGVYEHFFEPLLEAKFGDRKDDVSAAWLLGRIRFRGERDLRRGEILGYFDGSFGVLLDALVESVGRERIETNARVVEVEFAPRGEERVESVTVETESGTETHDTDAVVVATMPNVLEDLTGYECEIDFQGAVCALVTMDRQLMDTYWLNVAEETPFGALIEHTNFVPPERYGGEHLLYVASYVQSRDDWRWRASDAELEECWLDGISNLFPSFSRDHVESVRVSRNPRAAPVYERGYLETVIPYDLSEELGEGVYYAGMASRAQYPERSLDGGVVAGFECADRIAADASRAPTRSE
ncbi:MAG: FAD-dependent oxidoreductase, partial [Haloferacaceae archaeon]